MTKRQQLLLAIAETTADYRADDQDAPSPEHVNRWVEQFEPEVQLPILKEMDHVLKNIYLSKVKVDKFLGRLVTNKDLAGEDSCSFWAETNFMDIQKNGHSQAEMLVLFQKHLQNLCGTKIEDCGKPGGDFLYIDDVMFSGSRAIDDLSSWIEESSPSKATVHIVAMAMHTGGEYWVRTCLNNAIAKSGKRIKFNFWRSLELENQKWHKNDSEVLWPVAVPDDEATRAYMALPHRYPLELRVPGGKTGPFSSEEGRQLLEREFLVAGVKIRSLSQHPKDVLKPLGFSPFGVGFGSMIVTFRNCPNNCPLALWWGDPKATSGHFHWYPLFPRKTYAHAEMFDATL